MTLNAKPLPFRIKFCGVTNVVDVGSVVASGADAIGFNFFTGSRRWLSLDLARQLSKAVPSTCSRVGIFVDESPVNVKKVVDEVGLDFVQLHGNEKATNWVGFTAASIIKAIYWRGLETDERNADDWTSRTGVPLRAFLVDAFDPVARGGTGKTARWDLLNPRPAALKNVPLILAGGLTSDNVGEAIRVARPEAVDAASGIEVSNGIKSLEKMTKFVQQARDAW
jgi:phosphoribosylanthranilate isomerase